jgi:hypothetical protein
MKTALYSAVILYHVVVVFLFIFIMQRGVMQKPGGGGAMICVEHRCTLQSPAPPPAGIHRPGLPLFLLHYIYFFFKSKKSNTSFKSYRWCVEEISWGVPVPFEKDKSARSHVFPALFNHILFSSVTFLPTTHSPSEISTLHPALPTTKKAVKHLNLTSFKYLMVSSFCKSGYNGWYE